jgi:lipopolysaccharide export system permease protein
MKTLNLYITKSFLSTFLMAIGVLTFCMVGARLVKVFDYISQGVPVSVAGTFMIYIMPIALSFTIPWATLAAIMLIFGRMSADNEITAMRACGVSILQIISPILIITFSLTCLCLYLQLDVGPRLLGKAGSLVKEVSVNQPLSIIEPGIPVEMDSLRILVDEKIGENQIKDIQVFRWSSDGKRLEEDVSAASGHIETDKEAQLLKIILENATIMAYEKSTDKPRRSFSKRVEFAIDYGRKFNQIHIGKKVKYMTYKEIFANSIIDAKRGIDTSRLETELNQRVAMALAPIAFFLLGMPLAIRTSRRETAIGLFLSVILAGVYFGVVLTSDALTARPELHPEYLVWIPPVLYQVFGAVYLFKIARR